MQIIKKKISPVRENREIERIIQVEPDFKQRLEARERELERIRAGLLQNILRMIFSKFAKIIKHLKFLIKSGVPVEAIQSLCS